MQSAPSAPAELADRDHAGRQLSHGEETSSDLAEREDTCSGLAERENADGLRPYRKYAWCIGVESD